MLLGQLWLEMLRFYTLEFALEDYIISIRLKELLSREMKNWPRRRLAIEGTASSRRNPLPEQRIIYGPEILIVKIERYVIIFT